MPPKSPAGDVQSFDRFQKMLAAEFQEDFKVLRQGVTSAKAGSSKAITKWNLNLPSLMYDKETAEKTRATNFLKELNDALLDLTKWKK